MCLKLKTTGQEQENTHTHTEQKTADEEEKNIIWMISHLLGKEENILMMFTQFPCAIPFAVYVSVSVSVSLCFSPSLSMVFPYRCIMCFISID